VARLTAAVGWRVARLTAAVGRRVARLARAAVGAGTARRRLARRAVR
jgi:hypothetical protein